MTKEQFLKHNPKKEKRNDLIAFFLFTAFVAVPATLYIVDMAAR